MPRCEPEQYGPDTEQLLRKMRASVEYLNVNGLRIHSLPPLPGELKILKCSDTQITELPELPRGLRSLDCSDTPLTSLPELPESLEFLAFVNTRIQILPRLPKDIEFLLYGNSPLLLKVRMGETNQAYRARWNAWWDEKESMERLQARCAAVKEDLIAAAWAPARVERWLEAGVELEAM